MRRLSVDIHPVIDGGVRDDFWRRWWRRNRGVYVSTGDINNDGVADIVLSFASLTDAAEFPNVIVPRQQTGES